MTARSPAVLLVVLVAVAAIGVPLRFIPHISGKFLRALARLRVHKEQYRMETESRGYYESLADRPGADGVSWETMPPRYYACMCSNAPTCLWEPIDTDWRAVRPRRRLDTRCWQGVSVKTDDNGFRSPPISVEPAPGTTRIGIIGASYVFGMGVSNEETMPSRLEKWLNERGARRYEVFNASSVSYSAIDQVARVKEVLRLSPHVVLLVVNDGDLRVAQDELVVTLPKFRFLHIDAKHGARLPPTLKPFFDQARPGDMQAARKAGRDMTYASYPLIASQLRDAGVRALYTHIPVVASIGNFPASDYARMDDEARLAGFEAVDTRDVFDGYDPLDLWVNDWDAHPSAIALDMLARALAARLPENL